MFFAGVFLVAPYTFSAEQEGRWREKILKITPVSDEIPVAIKTIRYDTPNNPVSETKTATKAMRQKYRYDLAPNPNPHELKLANSHYERWFLSVGLNDSDPSDQQYGIWLSEYPGGINDDDYSLYIFSSKEQYFLWKGGGGVTIQNINNPINVSSELEKGMNTEMRLRPEYTVSYYLDYSGTLKDEIEDDARKMRIVSFNKTQDDDFCLTVESPKSKSIFVFVTDKEETDLVLDAYNRENEVKLKTAPPRMVCWKMKEFKTPAGAKTNKPFRNWFFPSESGEFHHVAKYVSCDGENVVLEKEDGQRVTVELSKISGYDRRFVNAYLEAEKSPQIETSNIP